MELRIDETLHEGLDRLRTELLVRGRSELRRGGAQRAQGAHETRKNCKKLRAWLRLLRSAWSRKEFGGVDKAVRNLARQLAAERDADVLAESYRGLRAAISDADERALWDRLYDGAPVSARCADLPSQWDDLADRVQALPLARVCRADLAAGVQRSYRAGLKRRDAAVAARAIDGLHDWRRASKYLAYQLRMLGAPWPELFQVYDRGLRELSGCLGEDHDLMLFQAELLRLESPPSVTGRAALQVAADLRRLELQHQAFAWGRRLYRESPRAFATRMLGYWPAATDI